ncbi:MAG: polysaccharide deacetylase family protein [Magnetospirillum sp.]|nr:polysaccharide deacetylase family protein [Magnetospirillum sp.]
MLRRLLLVAAALVTIPAARAEVIERLPAGETRVALTFDACEGRGKPAYLDRKLVDFLVAEKLPVTIFATGLFARRNAEHLAELAKSPLVEVENHSFDHPQHMEKLSAEQVRAQVAETDAVITEVTGRKPRFFRFPAGNYDAASLEAVESAGHRVVHWSFASGDPTPGLSPERLKTWVLSKTRGGDILIFHINGRAPATAQALPAIIAELRRRKVEFVRLDEVLR